MLEGAESSYRRALEGDDGNEDIRFNLARLQRQLSQLIPERRRFYLDRAAETLASLVRSNREDPLPMVLLGLVNLDLQNYKSAHDGFNTAHGLIEQSDTATLATCLRGRGTALLKLAERDQTIGPTPVPFAILKQAVSSASTAPSWPTTCWSPTSACSVSRVMNPRKPASRVASMNCSPPVPMPPRSTRRSATFTTPVKPKNPSWRSATLVAPRTCSPFHSAPRVDGAWSGSDKLFDVPAEERGRSRSPLALAHAHAREAEQLIKAGAALDDAGEPVGVDQQAVDAALDRAAGAYLAAGILADHEARRHLLALQAGRDPVQAYNAAWRHLKWRSFMDSSAWSVLIANYGARPRRGSDHPPHRMGLPAGDSGAVRHQGPGHRLPDRGRGGAL